MLNKYIEFNGKHPKGTKGQRLYTDRIYSHWNQYGCSYKSGFMKVDFDDYDHNTGDLVEPIHGKARSDTIVSILDNLGIRYNGIATEHGKHLFFKRPDSIEVKNKQNWYSPLAVMAEWKFPESDDHIPLKVSGKEREFFKGSLTNEDIDELPFFLYPLQKSKEKPFHLNFPEGERTNQLGGYVMHLVEKGFTREHAFQIVRIMNQYVFESPIPESTLNSEILNDSTFEKLLHVPEDKKSHAEMADNIAKHFQIISVDNLLYSYENGLYQPFEESKITEYMTTKFDRTRINDEKEVVRHITGRFRKDRPKDNGSINVKNGILQFQDGNFVLLEHSPENIQFKQFNAIYESSAKNELLINCLNQWFNNDSEQIESFKQLLGYLLMNHVKYQKVFFLYGPPGTGKSTVLNLIVAFCGKENVSAVDFDQMNKQFGLSQLVDKTANIFSDTKKGKVLSSSLFKMLADGSPIQIDRKFKSAFTYSFTGKLIFGMNNLPDFSMDYDGIARRAKIFKFDHVYTSDSKKDPDLLDKLTTENALSALLNLALDGYKSLIQNNGFTETKADLEAIRELDSMNDSVLEWLNEENITKDHFLNGIAIKALYQEYTEYCLSTGQTSKEQKDFTRTINNQFHFQVKKRRFQGELIRYFSE